MNVQVVICEYKHRPAALLILGSDAHRFHHEAARQGLQLAAQQLRGSHLADVTVPPTVTPNIRTDFIVELTPEQITPLVKHPLVQSYGAKHRHESLAFLIKCMTQGWVTSATNQQFFNAVSLAAQVEEVAEAYRLMGAAMDAKEQESQRQRDQDVERREQQAQQALREALRPAILEGAAVHQDRAVAIHLQAGENRRSSVVADEEMAQRLQHELYGSDQ